MSAFKLRKEKDCLNCGRIVEENFCPHCGQENIIVKEDALHMVSHAVADYFHFEHKFFGTIKPLLLKPGQLTKAYVEGKRVKFIHPIRLYIFISIVFFLVVLSGENNKNKIAPKVNEKSAAKDNLTTKEAKKLTQLKEAIKYIPIPQKRKDSIIKVAESDLKKYGSTNINLYTGKREGMRQKGIISKFFSTDTTLAQYNKHQEALPKDKRDGFIRHYFVKRGIELRQYPNPEEKLSEDLMHNIPKMMFLLLPLFALILKLVYLNKKKYYYEHLIYSFHIHSAMFLAVLFTMLLSWMIGFVYNLSELLTFFCIIYLIWYTYRSLRTFYGNTRWKTLLKMFFLFFCYNIVFTLCFVLIVFVSFVMI